MTKRLPRRQRLKKTDGVRDYSLRDSIKKRFRVCVLRRRIERNVNRQELCVATGIYERTMIDIERNKCEPRWYHLILISEALGVPITDLWESTDIPDIDKYAGAALAALHAKLRKEKEKITRNSSTNEQKAQQLQQAAIAKLNLLKQSYSEAIRDLIKREKNIKVFLTDIR